MRIVELPNKYDLVLVQESKPVETKQYVDPITLKNYMQVGDRLFLIYIPEIKTHHEGFVLVPEGDDLDNVDLEYKSMIYN